MQKLYKKNEIVFSIVWIVIYVVGANIADSVSERIGVPKLITLIFLVFLSAAALIWIKKNNLFEEYGICRVRESSSKLLFYIPLLISVSCNLWFGVSLNFHFTETVLFICSMICVGFIEELIFRGFLFKAMSRNGLKSAVIVSSLTFGIGHIVNLFNSSGANTVSTLCQIVYAAAFGFLFVVIFLRTKSLLPCIFTHSATNALSVFSDEAAMTDEKTVIVSLILTAIALGYSVYLLKTIKKNKNTAS